MTLEKVKAVITTALSEIQKNSGRKVPSEIMERMKPIGDFEGFDSLNGLELSVVLAAKLGVDPMINWCVSEDGNQALSIGKIVDRVYKESLKKELAKL